MRAQKIGFGDLTVKNAEGAILGWDGMGLDSELLTAKYAENAKGKFGFAASDRNSNMTIASLPVATVLQVKLSEEKYQTNKFYV